MATKITYTQQGDYLLPNLKLPQQPKVEIGIWGKRHLRYIKQIHPVLYTNLLTRCELTNYLADINERAEDMFFSISKTACQTRRRDRTTQSRRSNAVGAEDEQYPQPCRRNY